MHRQPFQQQLPFGAHGLQRHTAAPVEPGGGGRRTAGAHAGQRQVRRQLGGERGRARCQRPGQPLGLYTQTLQFHWAGRQRRIGKTHATGIELELAQVHAPGRRGFGSRGSRNAGRGFARHEPAAGIDSPVRIARQFDKGPLQTQRGDVQAALQQVGAHVHQLQGLELRQGSRRWRRSARLGDCRLVREPEVVDAQFGQGQGEPGFGATRPVDLAVRAQARAGLRSQVRVQVGCGGGQIDVAGLQRDLGPLVGERAFGVQLPRRVAGGRQARIERQGRVSVDRPAQLLEAQVDAFELQFGARLHRAIEPAQLRPIELQQRQLHFPASRGRRARRGTCRLARRSCLAAVRGHQAFEFQAARGIAPQLQHGAVEVQCIERHLALQRAHVGKTHTQALPGEQRRIRRRLQRHVSQVDVAQQLHARHGLRGLLEAQVQVGP